MHEGKRFRSRNACKRDQEELNAQTKVAADNIVPDNNGAYLVTASTTRQFTVNGNWSEDKIKIQEAHIDSYGEFHFKEKLSRAYETVHVNKDSVYSLIGITAMQYYLSNYL